MIQSVIKHLKVYKIFVELKVANFAEYKADFLMNFLATIGFTLISIVFIEAIFTQFDSLADWSKGEIIILYSIGQMVFYGYATFFSNIELLSTTIKDGNFDLYLLKPLNPVFAVSVENFGFFNMIPAVILNLYLIYYGINISNIQIHWVNIVLTIGYIILGIIFKWLIHSIIGYLALFIDETRDFMRFFYKLDDFNKYPIEIYPKVLQFAFKTFLPILIFSYLPSYTLINGFDLSLNIYYIISYVVAVLLAIFIYKAGIKRYSSASS